MTRQDIEADLDWGAGCACRVADQPFIFCAASADFAVKVPDGRASWRKARMCCALHLAMLVWQMRDDYGGYEGAFEIVERRWRR